MKQMATLYVERKPKQRVRYGREPGGSAGVVRAWHVWRETLWNLGDPDCSW